MKHIALAIGLAATLAAAPANADQRTFPAGTLVVPMDVAHQDDGIFAAYGLLFQLLKQHVPVVWTIDPGKTWDEATHMGTPDITVDGMMFRGGPFVIDASHASAAMPIIAAWNARPAVPIVTVVVTASSFVANAARDLIAAPTIAVFADGNEDIATGYLRAAGIPQSNGTDFPAAKCNGNCGPGTANPDLLNIPSLMGEMGTCDAPNFDHKNGALFRPDGLPAYCQIMSMHWAVNDREKVECNGNCGATQAACGGKPITFHGHEVVAEVRAFLDYPVHLFAECQAVNAYENTTPNPAWPWLDDAGRDGHFLTTLGFEIAQQPSIVKHLHPENPYGQLDGDFTTVNGSEPAYNLPVGGAFKNDRQVTLLTGPNGPGDQDVYMSGFVDGDCDIVIFKEGHHHAQTCGKGKVSYLGGHKYDTATPLSANFDEQGARLFLNALFEADCVTAAGQPSFTYGIDPMEIESNAFPVVADISSTFQNIGVGAALDTAFHATFDARIDIVGVTDGAVAGAVATWDLDAVSGDPVRAGDPPASGTRVAHVSFPAAGDYEITLGTDYRVGQSTIDGARQTFIVHVGPPGTGGDAGTGGDDDGGAKAGCCETGGKPAGSLALGLVVGLFVRRRRRLT